MPKVTKLVGDLGGGPGFHLCSALSLCCCRVTRRGTGVLQTSVPPVIRYVQTGGLEGRHEVLAASAKQCKRGRVCFLRSGRLPKGRTPARGVLTPHAPPCWRAEYGMPPFYR